MTTGNRAKDKLGEELKETKKCLVHAIEEGCRDWEMIDEFYARFKSYQKAMDLLTGSD